MRAPKVVRWAAQVACILLVLSSISSVSSAHVRRARAATTCVNCDPNHSAKATDQVMEKQNRTAQPVYSAEELAELQKNPAERTARIVNRLNEMLKNRPHHEDVTAQDIKESEHLLGLYVTLRKHMIKYIKHTQGKVPNLPSQEKTYVDASGQHWGDAQYKDSRKLLKERQEKLARYKMELAHNKTLASLSTETPMAKLMNQYVGTDYKGKHPAELDPLPPMETPEGCTSPDGCGKGTVTPAASLVAPTAATITPAAPLAPAGTPKGLGQALTGNAVTATVGKVTPSCPCGCAVQQCPCKCGLQSNAPAVVAPSAPPAVALKVMGPTPDCQPPLCIVG